MFDQKSHAEPLMRSEKSEALAFLAQRPLHTVYVASLISDNGVESPLNRGRLYSYRSSGGQLEGIALLGHATILEARSEPALTAFTELARRSDLPHLIRGEESVVRRFWSQYGKSGQEASRVCRELLLEQVVAPESMAVTGLRKATLADLESIVQANSEMARTESGSDPLERDPKGFRSRTACRILRGRNWIWKQDGRLLFKADIIAETPQAVYLEGVYVEPAERGKGYGSLCLAQLGRMLLRQTESVSLTLNAHRKETSHFYHKVGFRLRSYYDTIYLQQSH
jgi:predicted GNAT family acetyltransferase